MIVGEGQYLRVAVIGVIEARMVVVGFVAVMRRFRTDEVPMHQRLLGVRVQVRDRHQPRQHDGKRGDHRNDASGRNQQHSMRSMSARARQSQTCRPACSTLPP